MRQAEDVQVPCDLMSSSLAEAELYTAVAPPLRRLWRDMDCGSRPTVLTPSFQTFVRYLTVSGFPSLCTKRGWSWWVVGKACTIAEYVATGQNHLPLMDGRVMWAASAVLWMVFDHLRVTFRTAPVFVTSALVIVRVGSNAAALFATRFDWRRNPVKAIAMAHTAEMFLVLYHTLFVMSSSSFGVTGRLRVGTWRMLISMARVASWTLKWESICRGRPALFIAVDNEDIEFLTDWGLL